MEGRSAVVIDSYRWQSWKDAALSSERDAKRFANMAFVVVTGVAAVLGIVTLNDEWRYSAIIYAPVLGFLVWETMKSRIEQVRFRAVAHSLREVLVPGLVDAIDDAQLRRLVRYEVVYASGQKIRVIDDGGYVQFVIAGEEEESVAGWGGGGGEGFGGDGGGGGGGDGGGC